MASPATQVSVDAEIRRLTAFVRRMERRYERPSGEMREAIRDGEARETRDVARWLGACERLRELRERAGPGAAIPDDSRGIDALSWWTRGKRRSADDRTRRIPHEDGIREFSAVVRRMERRYECSSGEMLEAVRSGKTKETWDICQWLVAYDHLKALQSSAGLAAGSPTNATASSTKTASTP